MFDEHSDKWIRIYRGITIALFCILICGGLALAIGDASAKFLDLDLFDPVDGFSVFIKWIVITWVPGIVQLVSNMLIIQLLNNVQIIREKLEKQ